MTRRTQAEIMALLASDTPLNRARRILSAATGQVEQAFANRKGPVEARRIEFEAVEKIWAEKPGV